MRVRAACDRAPFAPEARVPVARRPSRSRGGVAPAPTPSSSPGGAAPAKATRARFSSSSSSSATPSSSSSSSSSSFLTPPLLQADEELWAALDVCLDDELEAVDDILHAPSPFSPLLKQAGGGASSSSSRRCSVARDGRASVMHRVEARLRYLAADARATLSGEPPTYREVLLGLRDALPGAAAACPRHLPTPDLEAELLHHALESRREREGSRGEEEQAEDGGRRGDGTTSPDDDRRRQRRRRQRRRAPASARGAVRGWADRLAAGVAAGASALPRTLAQLGGAAAFSAAGQGAARALASQYLTLARAAAGAAAASSAQRAVVVAAARYSALRGALALLGPAMWGALALDLALKALGPDHARVARAVFVLAQVRLVRTGGFVPPPPPSPPQAEPPSSSSSSSSSSPSPSPSSSPSAAFSERLYGPLGPDGVRAKRPSAAVPAEFWPLGGGDDDGRATSSSSGGEDGDDDDDDDDEQWLWGVA